jgi:pimeloyl-ACP methyl ester carboxylesterase
MAALLDDAGAKRAVVGGMSLGGYLSLAFHLRHPDRVAALILVDTGPGYRNDEARDGWNAWANGLADDLERDGMQALSDTVEHRAAEHVHGAAGLAAAARGILTQRDASVIESLPDVAVPTLIVVGEHDAPFLASADAMERRIPGARKVVLPDAGHAANMDQPELFNRAVLDFLEAL